MNAYIISGILIIALGTGFIIYGQYAKSKAEIVLKYLRCSKTR